MKTSKNISISTENKNGKQLLENQNKDKIKIKFEKLLQDKFSFLQPVDKWKQIMWHNDGNLIIALIFSAKKIKFCFFNNPNLQLDKLQRWGRSVYSQNLEISYQDNIDWKSIQQFISETLEHRK